MLKAQDLTEDSDIKIAGDKFTAKQDDGELAAEEFQRQKTNGNISKAYTLGDRLSELLFTTDNILAEHFCKKHASDDLIRVNAQVLFAFMAVTVMENSCPNSVTAQTAINHFHKQVKEKSPELHATILDSGAFSLYLLCVRDEKMVNSCIGATFAESCNMKSNEAIVKLGDDLYNIYLNICSVELVRTNFTS